MAARGGWRGALLAGGVLLGLAGCGGPAPTPLQARYSREEERALRYHAAGELPRALRAFQASLATAELIDDRTAILAQSLHVGFTALALGEEALADRNFQRAWRAAVALGDASGMAQARLGLTQVGLMRGEFEAASEAFRRALVEARERSDRAAELVALNGLGLAQKELGRPEESRELFREAEVLARAHGDKRLLAATLANRADLALRGGELGQAEPALAEAIELDRSTENLPGLAHDLGLKARASELRGDAPGALELYRQARMIARHTGQQGQAERYERAIDRLECESGVRLQQGRVKSIDCKGRSE